MSSTRRRGVAPPRGVLSLVLAALVVAAAACGEDDPATQSPGTTARPASSATSVPEAPAALPAAVQTLDIVGREYAFALTPAPTDGLVAGWTLVEFHNEGVEAHQVMFARVKDGVDLDELARVAGEDSSGSAAIAFVDMLGGVSYIGPGQSLTAMVDLPAGIVMAMCYVPDATGKAHALSGMTTMLNVAEPPTGATSPPDTSLTPGVDGDVVGTIELAADGYRIPESLPKGWYRVVNTDEGEDGHGLHELSIMRLGAPVSDAEVPQLLDDLASNAPSAVPLEALGGLGAISPGFEGYLFLDLPAGDYLAVDFMPDPGDPRPHLLDGYHALFTP